MTVHCTFPCNDWSSLSSTDDFVPVSKVVEFGFHSDGFNDFNLPTFPSDPPSDIPPDMPAGLVLPQCTLIRIVEDLTRESNETFYVFLSSEGDFSTVGIDVAEIHIIDNDCKPSFSFYFVLSSELKYTALLLYFARSDTQ